MTSTRSRSSLISIYIANLAAYNAGILRGAWLDLPASEEEITETLERIGCGDRGAEYAIHDYSTETAAQISAYENIYDLNELMCQISELDEYECDILFAYLEGVSSDIAEAIAHIDRCILYTDCDTLEDLAETLVKEGDYGDIPDSIRYYIDYAAIARDLSLENYVETSHGVLCYA